MKPVLRRLGRPGPFSSLLRFVLLLVLGLAGQLVFAQGGPPLITDDPGTPGNRNWEINVAYTQSRYSYGTVYEVPHIDLNYGYGPNVQLKLEGPLTIFNGPTANYATLGYTNWGVKWRFQEETKNSPAISTYPQILFVGNSGLSRLGVLDPGTDFFLPAEASKTFGHFIVDGEFGLLFRQFTGTQISTGICGEYDVSKTLALLGEIHYISSTSLIEDQFVWNLGLKKDFSEHESLICSAGRAFGPAHGDDPGFLTYIGIQFRLGPAPPPEPNGEQL